MFQLQQVVYITGASYNRLKTIFAPENGFPLEAGRRPFRRDSVYSHSDVIRASIVCVLSQYGMSVKVAIENSSLIYHDLMDGFDVHHTHFNGDAWKPGPGQYGHVTINLKAIRDNLVSNGVLNKCQNRLK